MGVDAVLERIVADVPAPKRIHSAGDPGALILTAITTITAA
jgi:hypothetical protein